jgi:hypothetical protein
LAVPVMSARKARWERRAHKGALGMPSLAQLGAQMARLVWCPAGLCIGISVSITTGRIFSLPR